MAKGENISGDWYCCRALAAVYSNGVAIRVMLEYIDYWGDQRVGEEDTEGSTGKQEP
jgi:hypothetical protein